MSNTEESLQQELKVFVTTPAGDVRTVNARAHETVRVVLERVYEGRLPDGDLFFFIEEQEEPVDLEITVAEAGITHRGQAHCAHSRRINVKVRYNGETATHEFPASAKIRAVEEWAEGHFHIAPADRAELVLRLCGYEAEENGDVRISKLAKNCEVCFDLGPKQRVQG